MRRALAFLVVFLFSWMLILPAFASTEMNLPACCRRSGKHKCMMQHSSEPGFVSIGAKCSCLPQSTSALDSQHLLFDTSSNADAELAVYPSDTRQVEAGYRISYIRSRQKRGPPSFLLA